MCEIATDCVIVCDRENYRPQVGDFDTGKKWAAALRSAVPDLASSPVLQPPEPEQTLTQHLQHGGNLDELEEVGQFRPSAPIRLADIRREELEWFWPGRLPVGKLVILEGEPEAGKTSLAVDLMARLTTARPMPDLDPDDTATYIGDDELAKLANMAKLAKLVPRNVMFLTSEDGIGDTIKPRFIAAGGDEQRFFHQPDVPHFDRYGEHTHDGPMSFPNMAHQLGQTIRAHSVSLVVIDGINSFLDRRVNPNSDPDVRRTLDALRKVAEAEQCTFIIIRHFNKGSSGNALNKGIGSIAWTGVARVVLQVSRNPDNDDERVLSIAKCNVMRKLTSLIYRIVDDPEHTTVRVDWTGESSLTADDLAAYSHHKAEQPEHPSRLDDAKQFILDTLQDGPMMGPELATQASAAKHKRRTHERARSDLANAGRIVNERDDNNRSRWRLADDTTTEIQRQIDQR